MDAIKDRLPDSARDLKINVQDAVRIAAVLHGVAVTLGTSDAR